MTEKEKRIRQVYDMSRVKGVSWDRKTGKREVRLQINNKNLYTKTVITC